MNGAEVPVGFSQVTDPGSHRRSLRGRPQEIAVACVHPSQVKQQLLDKYSHAIRPLQSRANVYSNNGLCQHQCWRATFWQLLRCLDESARYQTREVVYSPDGTQSKYSCGDENNLRNVLSHRSN